MKSLSPSLVVITLSLGLSSWACSGSADDGGDGGNEVGGGTAHAGGRSGAGGRGNPGSGSAFSIGGGAGEGPESGGRGNPGSGGRRGAGGNGPGVGGSDPGAGGSESSSGGASAMSCSGKNPPTQGQKSMTVDGVERGYYLIPSTTDEAVPLVIDFHGWGGKGEWEVGTFSFNYASEGKAVLMYPDGLQQDFGGGIGWDNRGNDTSDIHFVQALIAEAKQSHCIDESKVFMVGFSWGGWMATQAACALGDQVRAFISVAGGGPSGQCKGPVTGMVVHGTSDGSEPISSGISTRNKWTTQNGCQEDSSPALDGACVSYAGCSKPVLWCEHPGDHIVPSFIYDSGWSFLMGAP